MLKIDFEYSTPYGTFRDALYLPSDHQHTEAEIEQMQRSRLENWLLVVESPVEE